MGLDTGSNNALGKHEEIVHPSGQGELGGDVGVVLVSVTMAVEEVIPDGGGERRFGGGEIGGGFGVGGRVVRRDENGGGEG